MENRVPPGFLRSEQIVPDLPPIQSTDDFPYSLAVANPPTILLSTISRLAPPSKPPRLKRRPSTASSAKDKHDLLPPAPLVGDSSSAVHLSVADVVGGNKVVSSDPREHRSAAHEDSTLEEMNRKAHAAVAGLRAEASRLAGVGAFPFFPLVLYRVVDGCHASRGTSITLRLVSRRNRPSVPKHFHRTRHGRGRAGLRLGNFHSCLFGGEMGPVKNSPSAPITSSCTEPPSCNPTGYLGRQHLFGHYV